MRKIPWRVSAYYWTWNFDEYALYGYAMKLQLLERQRTFRYDRGKQAFDGLMDNIRQQISSL